MEIQFAKYHGAGNDFILIDNRNGKKRPDKNQIAMLCDRHFGIGADGLITLNNAADFDFHMTYFNSDGMEGSMCGNGGRCITAFALHLGVIKKKAVFSAIDGIHTAEIIEDKGNSQIIRISMNDVNAFEKTGVDYFINTGSPHFVRFVDDINTIDVIADGKKIRWEERFQPEGTNVNFVEKKQDFLYVKTFERGVEDHTLSCGTGNTASAMAAFLSDDLSKNEYIVESPGGKLKVQFDFREGKFSNVHLLGPAVRVFEGIIIL